VATGNILVKVVISARYFKSPKFESRSTDGLYRPRFHSSYSSVRPNYSYNTGWHRTVVYLLTNC